MYQEMKSWGPVPRPVRAALTPEKAVEHAEKMLPRDFRMRIFWPQDSQNGAMYLCKQGHVDLANYSSGSKTSICHLQLHDCCRPLVFSLCRFGTTESQAFHACASCHTVLPSQVLSSTVGAVPMDVFHHCHLIEWHQIASNSCYMLIYRCNGPCDHHCHNTHGDRSCIRLCTCALQYC